MIFSQVGTTKCNPYSVKTQRSLRNCTAHSSLPIEHTLRTDMHVSQYVSDPIYQIGERFNSMMACKCCDSLIAPQHSAIWVSGQNHVINAVYGIFPLLFYRFNLIEKGLQILILSNCLCCLANNCSLVSSAFISVSDQWKNFCIPAGQRKS